MPTSIARYEGEVYAFLRIVAGFLFLWHGTQKIFDFPPAGVPIPLWLVVAGGTIELVGGFLIMTGLLTRWAAFIASGEMAVAYWVAHVPISWHPIVSQGEITILFCFLFLYIATKGPGVFSLDRLREKRKEGK